MRPGVRIGVDVGRARIGVARCDPHALLATPVETVPRDRAEGGADIRRILALLAEIADYGSAAVEVVVGLPLSLSGARTPSTEDAVAFAERLAAACAPLPVRLVDERLSTVSAQGQLREAGKKTRQSRGIIDQAAAVVILQHALDAERARGEAPGEVLTARISPEGTPA